MATLQEIIDKSVQVKDETERLARLQQDKQIAQLRLTDLNTDIAAQLAIVTTLRADLKAIL